MDHSLYRYTCALLAFLLLSLSGTASAGWITELNKMNLAQPKQATKSLPVEASVRHRNTQTGASVYRRVHATIPVERIRTQAVSAAKRGRIHPGFFAATVAAGLLIDGDTGEVMEEVPAESYDTAPEMSQEPSDGWLDTRTNTISNCPSRWDCLGRNQYHQGVETDEDGDVTVNYGWDCTEGVGVVHGTAGRCVSLSDAPEDYDQFEPKDTEQSKLPEDEYSDRLDPYVLDRADDIARSVMDDPDSDWSKDTDADNKIRSPRGVPQNLRDKITRDRENTEAREKGEEEPHEETDGETTSSDDLVLDELTQDPDTLNTPEPPEPDWNVEEYGPDDLQPESIDVGGSAECPAPYSVELAEPFSGTFEIPFDYICDFAENVNPFFIAGAWLLAGFIVIRR